MEKYIKIVHMRWALSYSWKPEIEIHTISPLRLEVKQTIVPAENCTHSKILSMTYYTRQHRKVRRKV